MGGSSDDRFREMFYEEARELLIGLEEGLMELERRQGDRAHLDTTFRAAHSLKGAAAMVGLAKLAEFTHGIEAVLERVRSGTLAVDSDIITTLLEARDHLAAMVESEAARSPIPASTELSQRLSDLLKGSGPGAGSPAAPPPAPRAASSGSKPGPPPPPAAPPSNKSPGPPPAPAGDDRPPVSNAPPPEASQGQEGPEVGPPKPARKPRAPRKKAPKRTPSPDADRPAPGAVGAQGHPPSRSANVYRVTLAPGPDTLRRGINPLGALVELRELGDTHIETDPEAIPDLDEIDPERCYLTWTITVETGVGIDQLNEVFLFFAEDSAVSIERRTDDGGWHTVREEPTAAPVGRLRAGTVGRRPGGNSRRAGSPREGSRQARGPGAADTGRARGAGSTAAAGRGGGRAAASPPRAAARPNARIRVDATQLDDLVGMAGELAVLSDNLMGLREVLGAERWLHALESLQRVSREIRDTTLDLRMVPVDELFSRVPRIVRDLADRSGKQIELRIVGQDTRLDRTIVERLNDPMLHLIRNAVDHALEPPAEREATGKPRAGRITLSAGHEGDRVAIRVEDDGRGLDRDKIVKKGIALRMIAPGTAADDPRVVSLIFEPGFSTRDTVSELSGRGVGLDVVRDAVRALRGSVAVESNPGKGTAFIFRLPLTLALIDGLLVETGGGKYVVPLRRSRNAWP